MVATDAPPSLDAFRAMVRIRRFEEQCLRLGNEGVIAGSMHLCGGQEAIPVGACAAIGAADRVISTYRGHGWALARGVDPSRLMAEICHRTDGINGGRGGSAYFNAPEVGFLGENSIVGGGLPIACGAALAAVAKGTGGVVLVSFGDGAMNQGATHEALAFAAARRLPVVFILENNGWSEMTPIGLMARVDDLSRRVEGYGIDSAIVDGNDPAAVAAAVAAAAEQCRGGGGPVLLECKTVRLMAHYNRDIEHYRTAEARDADKELDPITQLGRRLADNGVSRETLDAVVAEVAAEIDQVVAFALASPLPDTSTARDDVYVNIAADRGSPVGEGSSELTYAMAVNEALATELESRPEVILYGEDVAIPGGVFGVTRNLQKRFGEDRVFDTPISESAILGSALGSSLEGMRPIVEIMWGDFLLVALDQLVNQAANVSYVSRGAMHAPFVVRMQQGATPGSCAQHSQSLEAVLAHIPGLRVGLPSTPEDAYAMVRAAVASPDPCILIESRALYPSSGTVATGGDPEPVGGARVRRTGRDCGVVTWGSLAPAVIAASEALEGEGIRVGVLDLRWLNPLDDSTIASFVAASGGRIVVAHEANLTGGFGAEISARITERHFFDLDAPVRRIGSPDTRIPASPELMGALVPDAAQIVDAVREFVADARPTVAGTRS